jgi:hypothetical protein
LPKFITVGETVDLVISDGIGENSTGGGACTDIVQIMIHNNVVCHKSCRSVIDKQKVEMARKRHAQTVSPMKTCRLSSGAKCATQSSPGTFHEHVQSGCIFCGKVGNKKELRKAATLGLDNKVKECAKILDDTNLLAKLAGGNLISIDALYHLPCLTRLYRQASAIGCDATENSEIQIIRAHVFDEVIDYIEDYCGSGESLQMAKMTSLYDNKIAALGYPSMNAIQQIYGKTLNAQFQTSKQSRSIMVGLPCLMMTLVQLSMI